MRILFSIMSAFIVRKIARILQTIYLLLMNIMYLLIVLTQHTIQPLYYMFYESTQSIQSVLNDRKNQFYSRIYSQLIKRFQNSCQHEGCLEKTDILLHGWCLNALCSFRPSGNKAIYKFLWTRRIGLFKWIINLTWSWSRDSKISNYIRNKNLNTFLSFVS